MNQSIGDEKTVISAGGQEPELHAGDRLGQYEIIKLLGRGGMGQVYLARHSMMRTMHAVKLLPSEHADRSGFVERFRSEAQVMATLTHPGIVSVTHSDVDQGRYYLVMEFVGGDDGTSVDLEQTLDAAPEGRLDSASVAHSALQLVDALAYAHSHGVIHRDLKPSNILLSQNVAESQGASLATGRPPFCLKITDFGLAKMVGEEWVQHVIQASLLSLGDQKTTPESPDSSTKSILGTYEYMSPEQRAGREVDERSDIYALGVILYRMITGRRIMGFPKVPSCIVEGLDPAWDDLIIQCLEGEVKDRFRSMGEVRDALKIVVSPSDRSEALLNDIPRKQKQSPEKSRVKRVVKNHVNSQKEIVGSKGVGGDLTPVVCNARKTSVSPSERSKALPKNAPKKRKPPPEKSRVKRSAESHVSSKKEIEGSFGSRRVSTPVLPEISGWGYIETVLLISSCLVGGASIGGMIGVGIAPGTVIWGFHGGAVIGGLYGGVAAGGALLGSVCQRIIPEFKGIHMGFMIAGCIIGAAIGEVIGGAIDGTSGLIIGVVIGLAIVGMSMGFVFKRIIPAFKGVHVGVMAVGWMVGAIIDSIAGAIVGVTLAFVGIILLTPGILGGLSLYFAMRQLKRGALEVESAP